MNKPSWDQFTDKEKKAVGNLFTFVRQLRRDGKIGRSYAKEITAGA